MLIIPSSSLSLPLPPPSPSPLLCKSAAFYVYPRADAGWQWLWQCSGVFLKGESLSLPPLVRIPPSDGALCPKFELNSPSLPLPPASSIPFPHLDFALYYYQRRCQTVWSKCTRCSFFSSLSQSSLSGSSFSDGGFLIETGWIPSLFPRTVQARFFNFVLSKIKH